MKPVLLAAVAAVTLTHAHGDNGVTSTILRKLRRHRAQRIPTEQKINSGTDYVAALRNVIQGTKCCKDAGGTCYDVSDSVMGALTYSDGLGGRVYGYGPNYEGTFEKNGHQSLSTFLSWATKGDGVGSMLNSVCCGSDVQNVEQCFCAIAKAVGLRSKPPGVQDDEDMILYSKKLDFVANTINGKVTNTTSQPGKIDLMVPTFENMLNIFNASYDTVFASLPKAKRPTCTPDAAVLTPQLEAAVKHGNSWDILAKDKRNADILSRIGATPEGIDGVTVESLASIGDELCTNVMAARAYMWFCLDQNPLNLGDGLLPGHIPEYVTVPNPLISQLPGVGQLAMSSTLPDQFCSSPAATAKHL